jgi:DNA repair exonuclease SbcCD nuclease subunit
MKVALITDTHHGIRNDAEPFLDMTKKFLDDIFFPTIKEQQIVQVIHLGDILDRRKYVNFATANRLWNDFLGPMQSLGLTLDLIYGNHDVYHKNTNSLAGPTELYRHLANHRTFRVYTHATDVEFLDGTKVLYVPWICDDNREDTLTKIERTSAQICLGHLELEGFDMYRGMVCVEGLSPSLFNKFDVTCSGHFHHKSSKNGIHYLGSHGEFNWADYNDERGFHIFDTKTRELEFIQNPYTMFEKVHYDDTVPNFAPDVSGKYVKVICRGRSDQIRFEQFISDLEKYNPVEIQVVDDHLNAGDMVAAMDEVDDGEDTLSIFKKATELYEGDRSAMDEFIEELYKEALEME